jgi:chromosome segregation protein
MRLTHLKLAGFKSFVDPTTLHIHGQRVGVVGPNGCGKSNVMESIRWVLGESSAKEMRGDSMQDVIFNGSANRKPVSRASVELLFDNSLGGASGEWSQYAEISVKRVLHRDGGSDYLINNTKVRRRDVADLFLGTGLGGRAYAIIGQNTISRIVEAKPDELRVFLEEAAGISKYKERRRETELRLRDTRENLTRVEDIRRELEKQLIRLESQAEVAQQYHRLKEQLALSEARFWLLKKRDAAGVWEKSQRQVERLANELEAHISQLRQTESQIEQCRLEHYTHGEQVQSAQGHYYEANAQVSALELELRHQHETRQRITAQLAQIAEEQSRLTTQKETLGLQIDQQKTLQRQAVELQDQSKTALAGARHQLPTAEQAQKDAHAAFSQIQASILGLEQQVQLERTHAEHTRKSLLDIQQRLQRVDEEERRLPRPDPQMMAAKASELDAVKANLHTIEQSLEHILATEVTQTEYVKAQQQQLQAAARQLTQTEAQLAALKKLQQSMGHESKLEDWLKRYRLDQQPRLWQCLRVAEGMETAVEGLLGHRLNAVLAEEIAVPDRPPIAVSIARRGNGESSTIPHRQGWQPLAAYVEAVDGQIQGVLSDWLAQVWLYPDEDGLADAQSHLQHGEVLVNRHGDIATKFSLSLHAPQSGLHGVLERQRELAQLESTLPALQGEHAQLQEALKEAEHALNLSRRAFHEAQQQQRQATTSHHALHMELQRLQQQMQHVQERQSQLATERDRLTAQQRDLQAGIGERDQKTQSMQDEIALLRDRRDAAGRVRQQAEADLKRARESLMEAERAMQQQTFSSQVINNKINELENNIKASDEIMLSLVQRHEATRAQMTEADDGALKIKLEEALNHKQRTEAALAEARNRLSAIELQLQEMERARLQKEQQLHPMRDRLEQSRLQEQQARFQFEHCLEQLESTGRDEPMLESELEKHLKASDLEQQGKAIQAEIDALGPVNLAAIQELFSERERKEYLDRQAHDLEEAIATLEEAIQRIDKETRSRLQHTYDEANRHFNELFQTLFGGGQAQLQLLGDEILDTGMQVFAQPPGKKNSTIHLLSGGEKALTAMALIFALFRLNPAPFCLMDEVDAPLDDSNTERFCALVRKMSERTQFMFVSHNKITMEMAQQLIGVTMQESGVSRIVEVDMEAALQMQTEAAV